MRAYAIAAVASAAAALRASGPADWLVANVSTAPTFVTNPDGSYTLSNGLISRTWCTSPGFATIDVFSAALGHSALRAIDFEGWLSLDNSTYPLGTASSNGVAGGYVGYLNTSAPGWVTLNASGWSLRSVSTAFPGTGGIAWTPGRRGSPATAAWPPRGLTVLFELAPPPVAPPAHQAVGVTLVYEIYTGAPLMAKWLVVNASTPAAAGVVVSGAVVETLRLNAPDADLLVVMADIPYGPVVGTSQDPLAANTPEAASLPVRTLSYPAGSPGVVLGGALGRERRMYPARIPTAAGAPVAARTGAEGVADFVSARALELYTDSLEQERHSLSVRKIFRLLSPWVLESPMFFHATNPLTLFEEEVDQIATVGFEMFIYSFGSGFNVRVVPELRIQELPAAFTLPPDNSAQLEANSSAYTDLIKSQVAYAHSKGLEVGGYDLICQDRGNGGYGGNVGDQWDCVAPDGSLGANACFASGWVDAFHSILFDFTTATGMSMVELDGPYGGGGCSATNHSHHSSANDAVYAQAMETAVLFGQLRSNNIYLNQPDNYFFQGGQRTGIGYNEDQFSLPRWLDVTITRQSIYDGTYRMAPTMGWTQVPLVDYHGGGPAAAFDPMSKHLPEFEMALAQNLGAGVSACYRGDRFYDAPSAQAVVTKWATIFKTYRDILTTDVIHIRRPDGQGLDAFMHAGPQLPEHQGFALVFNPTLAEVTAPMTFPLYYTGISTLATFSREGATGVNYTLARDYSVTIELTVPAQTVTWFVIADAAGAAVCR